MKIGIPTLLTIIFTILKLCHVIGWSWWWVLSPLWIVTLLAIGCFALVAAMALIETRGGRRRSPRV